MFYFYSKSPFLDVRGFAKQCIKKYSAYNQKFFFFSERVRQIQEKLEEFIQALNKEK
jgi:hypothetical protein